MINSQWKKLIAEEESFKETVLSEHNRIEPPVTAADNVKNPADNVKNPADNVKNPADNVKNPADNVNNPAHYGKGSIECIDYIEDFLTTEEYIGYLRGNIAKYLHRWRYKNKQEDLLKSQWYLDRLVHMDGKDTA